MPRVFVTSFPADSSFLIITGEQSRYISTVLRLKQGDTIHLFDSLGNHFSAVISKAGRGKIEVELKKPIKPPDDPPLNIILLQGVLKGQKMDLVIQKATELGVGSIVPLVTDRTVIRGTRRLERWRKVALEASRQCGRTSPPEVNKPREAEDYFSSESSLNGIIFWEEQGQGLKSLKDMKFPRSAKDIVVAVGPEGGFTEQEVEQAKEVGLVPVTLGPRILRAETAAITAVALVQHISGGLGG
jgi:16S rRNA (uracil1498-N3)-methyltransferase